MVLMERLNKIQISGILVILFYLGITIYFYSLNWVYDRIQILTEFYLTKTTIFVFCYLCIWIFIWNNNLKFHSLYKSIIALFSFIFFLCIYRVFIF